MKNALFPSGNSVEQRRAKIVCTLGPATNTSQSLAALIDAGMDIARLNFSHGTHAEHAARLTLLRRLAKARGKTLAVLQDLQGPKIRTGALQGGQPVELRPHSIVTLTTRHRLGDAREISTNYQELPGEVKAGNRILLADGLMELCVERLRGNDIECRVVSGGTLLEHQGINLPGIALKISALTDKDREDLKFGLEHGVDYVALSFVRRPEDVLELKKLLKRAKRRPDVVAKLEKPEAIDRLEDILKVADAVMVARGDLGVELAPEKVPVIQKHVIERANAMKVPVITATQMLESMTVNPRPTRAEASDVANAIFDGTDAVMLSAETASGRYPVESVRMMARIISAAEISPRYGWHGRNRRATSGTMTVPESICESVAHMTEALNISAIAVFTQSGSSARLISKYRPRVPVFAFSPLLEITRRTALYWGVHPVHLPPVQSTDSMVEEAAAWLRKSGEVKPGDIIAVIAGTPISRRGTTNLLKLHRIEK
ncbi:MAG TPA: pyruvate kinase [Terriglobia bacterium]|nr:pyruvate kinase [Terriglobia bacterium]